MAHDLSAAAGRRHAPTFAYLHARADFSLGPTEDRHRQARSGQHRSGLSVAPHQKVYAQPVEVGTFRHPAKAGRQIRAAASAKVFRGSLARQ
jgi:hypothetical protein